MARRNNKLTSIGLVERVDMETGEAVPIEGAHIWMMPNAPGTCDWCAVDHEPEMPHNQQSLYYEMKFHAINGRYPTWTDAMAHCPKNIREFWKEKLIETMESKGMEIPEDLR
jgi:hypothetical protein